LCHREKFVLYRNSCAEDKGGGTAGTLRLSCPYMRDARFFRGRVTL
jgi:hypothetical protein